MTTTLRIALVGAGAMGTLHARMLAESTHARLDRVVDPDPVRGGALAAANGVDWRPDDDLAGCDGVVIAAPTEAHAAWTQRAVAAGVPVLVEKPLSTRLDEAEAMVGAAAAAGVPLMCGFLERFNPAVRTALEAVPQPIHLHAIRHSPDPGRMRIGVAHDMLIHDLDLVARIAGPPASIAAGLLAGLGGDERGEDVVDAVLTYPAMLASLSASRRSQHKIRRLSLAGPDRLAEVDLLMGTVTVYRHVMAEYVEAGGRNFRQQTVLEVPFIRHPREPLAAQFEHFLALLRGDADAAKEREGLLEPHRLAAHVLESAGRPRQPA